MTTKQRFPLVQAWNVAVELQSALVPYVDRIEVAGSIRRGRRDVGDIELLIVPKRKDNIDMLGDVISVVDLSDAILQVLIDEKVLARRGAWGKLNKYFTHVDSGIPLDVFVGSVANWGRDLLIRTGPADFNIKVMSRFHKLGKHGHAYGAWAVTDNMGNHEAPTEEAMFSMLEWDYIEPEARA